MCYIGDQDDLDLLFFHETSNYVGPQSNKRKTNESDVFSMGEKWCRKDLLSGEMYDAMERSQNNETLPSYFLPHGSPPLPIESCKSADFLKQLSEKLLTRKHPPKAIVFMSPHFLREGFVVSSAIKPATIYDFDDDTDPEKLKLLETLTYPCDGSPSVAQEVRLSFSLFSHSFPSLTPTTSPQVQNRILAAGIKCETNQYRGMDHGIWTCLYLLFPKANIPVVSLSVSSSLSAREHILVGRALSPMSRKGVLLLGSGEVVHNVPLMGKRCSKPKPFCIEFEKWLEDTSRKVPGSRRDDALCLWKTSAPFASEAHPLSQSWPSHMKISKPFTSPGEHLMPWFFCFGAGGYNATVKCVSKEYLGSLPMAGYLFEEKPVEVMAKVVDNFKDEEKEGEAVYHK